ncbi:MAG TPA: class I SAM-dependent methyltransferase [Bryobacteraceae bacterium]|nr:class I SAM-dependent methyltransferase [Bryobacteraceae bacterium]
MTLPDAGVVLDLIEAFRRSKTLFTAVRLGVFDRLQKGPAGSADLAAEFGANRDALERLLDACAALGLLEKVATVYRNLPVAEHYLCSDSPHTMHAYIVYSDEALYPMWTHLESAVREGTPRWGQTFGVGDAIFSGFFRTEAAMRDFLQGMHGFGMLTSPRVVEAFDLSRFRTIVDLGGATGHLAMAACERYPDMRGVVFDLPQVVAMVGTSHGRVEFRAGDFFEDELPEGDLYAMGRILHDWGEDKIHRLLTRIFARLPVGGGVLVAEMLLAEDGVGPVPANLQSLNMLVVTEGRERSLEQYRRLLEQAGFSGVEGRRTGVALDAVMAAKE